MSQAAELFQLARLPLSRLLARDLFAGIASPADLAEAFAQALAHQRAPAADLVLAAWRHAVAAKLDLPTVLALVEAAQEEIQ